MAKAKAEGIEPPKLRQTADGQIDVNSLADLLEWFLKYDERTARMRLADTEELFRWKQADDEANGVGTYPFENAEARFAIGVFQALAENNTEPLLHGWISDVLNALHKARESKTELTDAYNLDADLDASSLKRADGLTTKAERRLYLTSCWLEVLCTAEARFLGWVYQEIFGKPFAM
jgi:hypothetical protein